MIDKEELLNNKDFYKSFKSWRRFNFILQRTAKKGSRTHAGCRTG